MGFLERLQHIDRRIMYVLLALVIAAPMLWNLDLPILPSPAAVGVYDTVENMPDNKIAIVSANWAAGTQAENRPQTEAIIRHLFMRNKRFAVMSFDPQGSKFADDIATSIAEELGKEYGTDWVHWGFRPYQQMVLTVQGIGRNIPKAIGTDKNGTPLAEIPMMQGVESVKDVGLIAEITPSATLGLWIAFIYGPYRTPIVYAPTSVSGPEGFNWLDSGQIKGMLVGMKGAAEYEQLIGSKGFATRGASALSSSHLLIIALIVLGNVGYIISRRRRAANS